MSQNLSEPNHIERDLDQTRTRLHGHLGELQQRLTPGQVLDDLMRYFRGKEGADFGRSLIESVRGNPLPAAITGVGLTWLMASNPRPGSAPQAGPAVSGSSTIRDFRGKSDPSQASYNQASYNQSSYNQGGYEAVAARVRTAEQEVTRGQDEAEYQYTSRLDTARGQALGLARHSQETTESFSGRVRDALASAQQALSESAHNLRDQASGAAGAVGGVVHGAGQSIGDAAQRAGDAMAYGTRATGKAGGNLISSVTESPVLLGALGLAAGALLGALLPQLEQEEATLGGIAAQVRDGAKGFAQDAVDKGGNIAQAVLDKSGDSAQAHGLTGTKGPGELVDAALSGNLARDIKEVAEDVIHSSDEAVRKEVLGHDKDGPAAG